MKQLPGSNCRKRYLKKLQASRFVYQFIYSGYVYITVPYINYLFRRLGPELQTAHDTLVSVRQVMIEKNRCGHRIFKLSSIVG